MVEVLKKLAQKTTFLKRKPKPIDPDAPLEPKKRDRSKFYSVLDGSMHSISAGLTGNFISAYAIALGSTNFVIALLATLPNLIAAVAQLGVQHVRGFFKTRKKHIVFFAVLQSLMWLPLIFAPQLQHPGGWLLLFVTLNAVFGMLIGPIWNSFISDIVEEEERGRFFGMRNMFTGLSAFVATFAAGYLLSVLKPIHPYLGFMILFAFAFLFRMASAYFLFRMDDPSEKGLSSDSPDIVEFVSNVDKTPLGKFTIFLMLFNISVFVASPFFAVYQLSVLNFDYMTFTLLASVSAVTSFLTMLIWGRYVDSVGSKNVLVACGFIIPFVPLIWALSTQMWVLVVIEAVSGIAWAGFNLSVSTYLFDATDRRTRTRELAEYTLMIQLAVFFGAILGSGLLGFFDRTSRSAFVLIFITSFILRLAVMAFFAKSLKELRIVEVPVKGRIFKKFISIKPHHGVEFEPAIETVPEAGRFARQQAKEISQEVTRFAKKKNPTSASAIKKIEQAEDEQDTNEFLKKLKK